MKHALTIMCTMTCENMMKDSWNAAATSSGGGRATLACTHNFEAT